MIIEKDISQLFIGAYVVGIVKQSGHVKIKNPGWIRDFHAIEVMIHEGITRVQVDTSKSMTSEQLAQMAQAEETESLSGSEQHASVADNENVEKTPSRQKQNSIFKVPPDFGERLAQAKQLYDEAKGIQANVLRSIESNQPIDTGPVVKFVDQSISTIFENPDALTCVLSIRTKDEYLLEHSVSVSILMTIFARHLGFQRDLVEPLAVGAFLHDVGKIRVPDEILNKPGKLTEAEFDQIKMHAVHSRDIVDATPNLHQLTREIVANHHEKLNGQGYPRGINESQLSTYDRMIAICDIFDALSADRVYKKGLPLARAFAILRELAQEHHLDTSLVDQFIRCMGVYPIGSLVKLSSSRLAIVEERSESNPTKPIVTAFFNLNQNVFTTTKRIDLSKSEEERIEKAVTAGDFDLDMKKISEFLMLQG